MNSAHGYIIAIAGAVVLASLLVASCQTKPKPPAIEPEPEIIEPVPETKPEPKPEPPVPPEEIIDPIPEPDPMPPVQPEAKAEPPKVQYVPRQKRRGIFPLFRRR